MMNKPSPPIAPYVRKDDGGDSSSPSNSNNGTSQNSSSSSTLLSDGVTMTNTFSAAADQLLKSNTKLPGAIDVKKVLPVSSSSSQQSNDSSATSSS
jgi:hypothetical protein